MIKVGQKVEEIIRKDHEAALCLSQGILNLSAYARKVHKAIEKSTKKSVKLSTIIMALSRLKRKMDGVRPMLKDIKIDGITVKTPLAEIVFEKNSTTVKNLSVLEKIIKPKIEEWFSFSQNTSSIIVICNEQRITDVIRYMKSKPVMLLKNLSAVGLSLSGEMYHPKPNITFSLLHKIAEKEIPLAETISTWNEIIFIFKSQYLSQILEVFNVSND